MRLKNYDYYLIIFTTLILFAIGLVSVYGITYYNYLSVDPQWTRTAQYGKYIDEMNSYIYPFLLLLLISLGLCIPKRLFEQDILVKFGAAVLGVMVMLVFLRGIGTGLGFMLAVMIAVQAVILILTFKKSQAIRFEKEGYMIRLGSSLLHLGIVILVFNFVSLRDNPFHILIFWTGTLLVVAGNIFSFYPERVTSLMILIK
ncbi:hypothetical protein [Candidatus Methanoperedens nitratireducens]|uniref:Uncharacterized protein n=1 Tax=Candidatus Methanoperedens nitratireducens TaxID=1392998 RepID=A0A284VSI6_9EURY|nr:hypothetical protein [Candidatus Methanoperedens nitroreducens]SNQ62168.1 conserved membrane hypothetical protein [Candidatus Methanoperedens nitroreducens]